MWCHRGQVDSFKPWTKHSCINVNGCFVTTKQFCQLPVAAFAEQECFVCFGIGLFCSVSFFSILSSLMCVLLYIKRWFPFAQRPVCLVKLLLQAVSDPRKGKNTFSILASCLTNAKHSWVYFARWKLFLWTINSLTLINVTYQAQCSSLHSG